MCIQQICIQSPKCKIGHGILGFIFDPWYEQWSIHWKSCHYGLEKQSNLTHGCHTQGDKKKLSTRDLL